MAIQFEEILNMLDSENKQRHNRNWQKVAQELSVLISDLLATNEKLKNLPTGPSGKSAYELWKELGNTGTLEQFVASLKGAKGDKGDTGATGPMGPQGPQGPKGTDSASLIWKAPVNTFSEIATTYTAPFEGWAVFVRDTGKVYRRTGTTWLEIQDIDPAPYNALDTVLSAKIDANKIEVAKAAMKPKFVEYFGSFSKFGQGVPSGVSNYASGNYVLNVTGNVGDTFVTVTSGNISHAGGVWPCVIQNDDGIFDLNKVMSNDGVNKINLHQPLKRTITNGKLGNLHDAVSGQHYTELGYYAFAQHLYFANTRYTERDKVLAQFLGTDTSGPWITNATSTSYNTAGAIMDAVKNYNSIGSRFYTPYFSAADKYVEWEIKLSGQKGYLETYQGLPSGTAKLEFFLDDVLVDTRTIAKPIDRYVFPFENAKKGKMRVTQLSGFPYSMRVGKTTWFLNDKYQNTRLINPSDKVVYIGDSWGEYHNKATTRELERLMRADGGSPLIWNFSRGGHTSDYAKDGFYEYVIKNKPDKVIIEYFTNDFNSIRGTVLNTFTAVDGTQKDMNIKDINEYIQNMQWMIDEAIKNGIQPIIVMPNGTNSESQTQAFMDFANQIWNGQLISVDEATYKKVTTEMIISPEMWSKDSAKAGEGLLKLVSKEVNSSIRKGIVSDSGTGANLTGGDIHGFYNNGVRKAGIRFDGTVETPLLKLATNTSSIAANAGNLGVLYFVKSTGTNNQTELWINVEKADGSIAQAKLNYTLI